MPIPFRLIRRAPKCIADITNALRYLTFQYLDATLKIFQLTVNLNLLQYFFIPIEIESNFFFSN